jgi:hypothetical protein
MSHLFEGHPVRKLKPTPDHHTWDKYGKNYTSYASARGRTMVAIRQADGPRCQRDLTFESTHRNTSIK